MFGHKVDCSATLVVAVHLHSTTGRSLRVFLHRNLWVISEYVSQQRPSPELTQNK